MDAIDVYELENLLDQLEGFCESCLEHSRYEETWCKHCEITEAIKTVKRLLKKAERSEKPWH